MGNLKPIGSEKLEGMAKIKRMIELSTYKETKPQNINENSSNEYSIELANGFKYHIVKEKSGYVIKKGLNESTLEYLEPIKGRKFYGSYSQALKRLNLITKEVNLNENNDKNISLFTEGEEGDKKYFLSMKRETKEQAPAPVQPQPQAQVPAPAPAPAMDTEVPPPGQSEIDEPSMPEDEMDGGVPEEQPTEEVITFKTIQKLTGKLGQKLRALNSDEEKKMTSKDVKYVINSILSALDLNSLEDEDREEIMTKFEGGGEEMSDIGGEDMSGMETDGTEDMSGMTPEGGQEMEPTPPPAPETQESYDSIDEYEMDENYGFEMDESDDYSKMDEMIEGIFSESKVDKILKKYFKLDEKERKIVREKNEKKSIVEDIKRNSKTMSQQVAARKFLNENKNVKYHGKNGRNDLVFKKENKTFYITKNGSIL